MTIEEINHEISLLEPAEVNSRNVQVLSSLYTIRENLSMPFISDRIPNMDKTEFQKAISGMSTQDLVDILDELMDTLEIMYPKLYSSVMQRLM